MIDLEYLIIYENDGTPVYSRCFGNLCKIAMQDDVLFAAFLSSLSTFTTFSNTKLDEVDLNGIKVQVQYKQEKHMNSLLLDDLKLVFIYNHSKEFTIAAGFNSEKYDKYELEEKLTGFFEDVEKLVLKHDEIDWGNVSTDVLIQFETELLRDVIHPFFKTHDMKDVCPFGDNCPMRIAYYEETHQTIGDRINATVQKYKEMSIFRKIWLAMTSSKYKIRA